MKGYSDEVIVQSGLASIDEKHGIHDKFWNRVMFPIMDATRVSLDSEDVSWETESPNTSILRKRSLIKAGICTG